MKPTKRLEKNISILKNLVDVGKKKIEREKVIKGAKDHTIHTIVDCATNVLIGNIKLTTKQRQRLKYHANFLKKLAHKKSTIEGKREIIIQEGAGLPALLIPVLTAAASIIGGLIDK